MLPHEAISLSLFLALAATAGQRYLRERRLVLQRQHLHLWPGCVRRARLRLRTVRPHVLQRRQGRRQRHHRLRPSPARWCVQSCWLRAYGGGWWLTTAAVHRCAAVPPTASWSRSSALSLSPLHCSLPLSLNPSLPLCLFLLPNSTASFPHYCPCPPARLQRTTWWPRRRT